MNFRKILLAIICIALNTSIASEYIVNSIASFNSVQQSAATGDVIIWKNNTYSDAAIVIYKNGLTIKSESPGGVIFNGISSCKITGNLNVFTGFQYIQGDIGDNQLLEVSGSNNKITQINFFKVSAHKYVVFMSGSVHNELSYCNIEGKPMTSINSAIQISTSPTVVGYHVIKYCSFKNFPGPGGDAGNEPIRIGLGAEKFNVSRTIVEYCYFENVGSGDSESISIKSAENVCRYNTFNNNPGGMLVFRQGYRNAAYGNFFINGSGGIRVKAGDHDYIYNNYFSTGSEVPFTLNYEAAFPLDKVYVLHNTFIDCAPLSLTVNGPQNIFFGSNIFKKSSGSILDGTTSSIAFTGNIISGNFGIPIPSGNKEADPQFKVNNCGFYDLSAISPAIDSGNPECPSIMDIPEIDDDPLLMLDICGRPRPADKQLKDVGCAEYSPAEIKNRPLKLSEVGPTYLINTIVEKEK